MRETEADGPEKSEVIVAVQLSKAFALLRQPAAAQRSVGGQLKPNHLDYPSLSSSPTIMSSQHHSSSPNLVGGHYRVGRKIGEGSFGVIFEGLFSSGPFPSFPPP